MIALSIPYLSFVTSGRFPVARAFSQCAEPQRGRCSWFIIGSIMLIPLFMLLLLLGREADKKTRSVLLVSQPVASKGCPLSAGCWSSLLRGSRIQQPNLKKGQKRSRSYEAYLIIMKRGKGFFGWCAGAHFRFPFTSRGVPWFLCRRVSRSFSFFSASTRSDSF